MYKTSIIILLTLPVLLFCSSESQYDATINNDYPDLYEAVYERDGEAILTFTDHSNAQVRSQAWRAMISTQWPVDEAWMSKVKVDNSMEAWASLWLQVLNEEQLNTLHSWWQDDPDLRNGIASVLAEHGNAESYSLLFNTAMEESTLSFDLAFALGSLGRRFDMDEGTENAFINLVASYRGSPLHVQALLYGYYRQRKPVNSEQANDLLMNVWNSGEITDPAAMQYLARVLSHKRFDALFTSIDTDAIAEMNTQLAIEYLRLMTVAEQSPEKAEEILENALEHDNPSVRLASLDAIYAKPQLKQDFRDRIENEVIEDVYEEPMVRLHAITALDDKDQYAALADSLSALKPNYLIYRYQIWKDRYSTDDFFERMNNEIQNENELSRFYAVQSYVNIAQGLGDNLSRETISLIRLGLQTMIQSADRSTAYVFSALLNNPAFFPASNYDQIEQMLTRFHLPEDVEVYQSLGSVLKERFEEASKALVDSVSAKGNSALNSSWREAGLSVTSIDNSSVPSFRPPNWDRLAELGPRPVMVFETEKGRIRLQADPLIAPATVSAMDSLIRAGAYNEVPFHRVVPNFVIQGGDFETRNGFGGPDYVIPTESSEVSFFRGKAGIASAGTDTEGSQYFMMHQWAPHLNGRYTIFGEVIEGMEVADRILPGDLVIEMYWE